MRRRWQQLYEVICHDWWLFPRQLSREIVTMGDAVREYAGWQADLGWSADLLERDVSWRRSIDGVWRLMHIEWLAWAMQRQR